MIAFERVSLSARLGGSLRRLLDGCSFRFADPRMLVLSPEPQARSAILGLITGQIPPQRGRVRRGGRVSWAVGPVGPFRSSLTGRETIGFFCGVYGLRRSAVTELVTGLMDAPVRLDVEVLKWSAAAQVQLNYALALAPDFDVYVLDGPLRLAYPAFDRRWRAAFDARVRDRRLIMATAQTALAPRAAPVGALLEDGRLRRVTNVRDFLQTAAQAIPAPEEPPSSAQTDDQDSDLL